MYLEFYHAQIQKLYNQCKSPKIPRAKLKLHIDGLCQKHNIGLNYWLAESGLARTHTREIYVPFILSYYTYAVALHEIGHIVCGHYGNEYCLKFELEAWLWAEKNAMTWNAEMSKAVEYSLGSYYAYGDLSKKLLEADRKSYFEFFEHLNRFRTKCGKREVINRMKEMALR